MPRGNGRTGAVVEKPQQEYVLDSLFWWVAGSRACSDPFVYPGTPGYPGTRVGIPTVGIPSTAREVFW
eukprot:702686-Rhodomonas_salina.1